MRTEPKLMWAISTPCGSRPTRRQIYGGSVYSTRRDAIAAHVKACGRTWQELYRSGDRCVPVIVHERGERDCTV